MTQLNESMEFNSPQTFLAWLLTSCLISQSSFWFAKNVPDGLSPIFAPIQVGKWGRQACNWDAVLSLEIGCTLTKGFGIAEGVRKWQLVLKRVNQF